jgi:hypothetical protein
LPQARLVELNLTKIERRRSAGRGRREDVRSISSGQRLQATMPTIVMS